MCCTVDGKQTAEWHSWEKGWFDAVGAHLCSEEGETKGIGSTTSCCWVCKGGGGASSWAAGPGMLSLGFHQSPGGGRDIFSGLLLPCPLPISCYPKCFHPPPPFCPWPSPLMLVHMGVLQVEDGEANSGTEGREGVLWDTAGRGMGVVA